MNSLLLKKTFLGISTIFVIFLSLASNSIALAAPSNNKIQPQAGGFDEGKKIVIDNQTNKNFNYVVCDGTTNVNISNQIPLGNKSGNLYFADYPDIFDKTIQHNLSLRLLSDELAFDISDIQTVFPFSVCNGSAPSLAQTNFTWKPGVVNKIILKGNITSIGGNPTFFKLYQPEFMKFVPGPTLYPGFVDLNLQSQKIFIANNTYSQGTQTQYLELARNLNEICANGNLTSLNTLTENNQTKYYYNVPSGNVDLAKANYNFANPCDTTQTGEYKKTVNIEPGTEVYFDFQELAGSGATKKGLGIYDIQDSSDTSIYMSSGGDFSACVDGVYTSPNMQAYVPLSPGVHYISPSVSGGCVLSNQTIKFNFQTNKKYLFLSFDTRGLDFVKSQSGINFKPYQEGFGIGGIDINNGFCVNGVLQTSYTKWGSVGAPFENRFYPKAPGIYDVNLTDNGNCTNPKYAKNSLEVKSGKYTNSDLGQFINPDYKISGLTFEASGAVITQTTQVLHLDLGNFNSADKHTLKLRCTAGVCKVDTNNLPASNDGNTFSYDIDFEFESFAEGFSVDLGILNSGNAFPNLSGNLLNGITFTSNCNSCISKISVKMVLNKDQAEKYKEIKAYYSNSPWQPASNLQTAGNSNQVVYTAQVNGSFRQLAFAGTLATADGNQLSATGQNISYSVLGSIVLISGLMLAVLNKREVL